MAVPNRSNQSLLVRKAESQSRVATKALVKKLPKGKSPVRFMCFRIPSRPPRLKFINPSRLLQKGEGARTGGRFDMAADEQVEKVAARGDVTSKPMAGEQIFPGLPGLALADAKKRASDKSMRHPRTVKNIRPPRHHQEG